jgi:hypothetical protein
MNDSASAIVFLFDCPDRHACVPLIVGRTAHRVKSLTSNAFRRYYPLANHRAAL